MGGRWRDNQLELECSDTGFFPSLHPFFPERGPWEHLMASPLRYQVSRPNDLQSTLPGDCLSTHEVASSQMRTGEWEARNRLMSAL